MKIDRFVKMILLVIAGFLAMIAMRPYVTPPAVKAQPEVYPLYFEPGTTMLRAPDGSQQVLGKVAVDMRNGNVWGFPTLSQDSYPAAGANTKPPTSRPFLLGKFALADTEK